jgi:tripartite-type tricarboxylate transporter receptor subunit TctC
LRFLTWEENVKPLRRLTALVAAISAAATTLIAAPAPAPAQDYPTRAIRLVVAFTAGGTTDFMARLIADRLKPLLGQTVIVENRPGANGAIGAEFVAKAEADGYTLFFSTVGAVAINPGLRADLPYDPARDFAPVSLVAFNSTMLVVNRTMKVNSATELAALAREKPGTITIGVTGIGAVSHLGVELFQAAAGIKLNIVPYRGAAQAITDMLGGNLDGLMGDVPTVLAHVRAGKLKALAATSTHRSDIFPEVPTFVEQGFAGTVADQWAGVLAPARTPPAVIAKLNGALMAVLNNDDIRHRLKETGVTPSPGSPHEFGAYLKDEIARYTRLIREKGIKGE